MRDAFVKALLVEARSDKRIMLVTGDLGFGVLNEYCQELPAQYINAGVAEQNMTGLSAGLALEGRIVFTYSIANFPTLRCLEQIRNDVAYHDASVNVVAVGGGFSYGALGMSHHATEDVAIMRALPGMRVFAPCDEFETVAIVKEMVAKPGPTYLRLDKSKASGSPLKLPFVPGRIRQLREGAQVAIVGYGGIMGEAISAADTLAAGGVHCAVFSASTLKPFDTETLAQIATQYETILVLEEHVPQGGLGSLAAEVFVETRRLPKHFTRMCLPDSYSAIVGSQEYLRARHGLDASSIVSRIKKTIAE
jgi:transketolase